MFSLRKVGAWALAMQSLAIVPAQAALVNDYSMTDDVWNTPVAHGHALVDLRTAYTLGPPGLLNLPVFSLAYGLAPNAEVGVWSAYTFSGIGSGALALLNPYVKYQLPFTVGKTTFGLVAGAQLPTRSGMEHDVALEGVAVVPLTDVLTVDLNLGAGRNLVDGGSLGHLNATAYYTLPIGPSLVAAAFANLDSAAPTVYGQQLGIFFPLAFSLSVDATVFLNETASNTNVTPMIGVTKTF
jgi:hypothetical protein